MKSIVLLFLLHASLIGYSQIPNANFEAWSFGPWSQEPDGWVTPNNQLQTFVVQDQNAYEGQYAMRVIALPIEVGKSGTATATFPIDYIPPSLDFHVKTAVLSGLVSITISFFNEELFFNSFTWNSGESIDQWTLVSIPMEQNEPVLTHAVISVEALVGDFVKGTAEIAVDAMGFGQNTSTDNYASVDFEIYPNPAGDRFTIIGINDNREIRIFNALGQEVMNHRSSDSKMVFDASSLNEGLYLIEATTGDDRSSIRKLIVSR